MATDPLFEQETKLTISVKELAVKLAGAFSDQQAEFALTVIDSLSDLSANRLGMQLHAIAGDMLPGQRDNVVEFAKKVIEYFEDRANYTSNG